MKYHSKKNLCKYNNLNFIKYLIELLLYGKSIKN